MTVIVMCLGIAWLTSLSGLSLALGAFIAGLVISESEYSHQATAEVLPFRDSFNSLFFVSIGILMDWRILLEYPGVVALWSKFWINFFFLLVPAEILIIITNNLMNAAYFMKWLSVVTMAGMTCAITSLGMGCGSRFPRFNAENVSQVATGFGGMFYMIVAVLFIGLMVTLEARPVYLFFMARFRGVPLKSFELAEITALLSAALLLNVLAVILPMRLGLKKLGSLEV